MIQMTTVYIANTNLCSICVNDLNPVNTPLTAFETVAQNLLLSLKRYVSQMNITMAMMIIAIHHRLKLCEWLYESIALFLIYGPKSPHFTIRESATSTIMASTSQSRSMTTVPNVLSYVDFFVDMYPQRSSSPTPGRATFARLPVFIASQVSRYPTGPLSGMRSARHLRVLKTRAMMEASRNKTIYSQRVH